MRKKNKRSNSQINEKLSKTENEINNTNQNYQIVLNYYNF